MLGFITLDESYLISRLGWAVHGMSGPNLLSGRGGLCARGELMHGVGGRNTHTNTAGAHITSVHTSPGNMG